MSLTREQWFQMWNAVKEIELQAKLIKSQASRQRILNECGFIRKQIEAVVGQME